MSIFFSFFYPFIVTGFIFLLIKPLVKYLSKSKFLDVPKKRSNHKNPIPKGAGLILIPTIFVSIVFFIYFELIPNKPWTLLSLLMLILFITSIFDDYLNLPTIPRLLVHSICVFTGVIYFNSEITNFTESLLNIYNFNFNLIITVTFIKIFIFFFWLWLINLFNFMDGMDGITTSQILTFTAGTVFLSIFGSVSHDISYISLIIFSAFLGFLSFNYPPAKIFLGDSGSIPIGFLISSIIIFNLINQQNFIPTMILIMYHFADSSLTLMKRLFEKKNIFHAHSEHFYQKKIRSGFSHKFVLLRINSANLILLFLSVLYLYIKNLSLTLSFINVFVILCWLNKKNDFQK